MVFRRLGYMAIATAIVTTRLMDQVESKSVRGEFSEKIRQLKTEGTDAGMVQEDGQRFLATGNTGRPTGGSSGVVGGVVGGKGKGGSKGPKSSKSPKSSKGSKSGKGGKGKNSRKGGKCKGKGDSDDCDDYYGDDSTDGASSPSTGGGSTGGGSAPGVGSGSGQGGGFGLAPDPGFVGGVLTKVNISIQPAYWAIPIYAAQELGWFAELGLEVDMLVVRIS